MRRTRVSGTAELAATTSRQVSVPCLLSLADGYARLMRRGTSVVSITVLAGLIVLNLLLLVLLFRPDQILTARQADQNPRGGSPATGWSPRAMSSASASGDQSASASIDASTDPIPSTDSVVQVPVERLLLAMSPKTAWRATVGDCNTPGQIERTTNGGTSWERMVNPGPAPIVRLGAEPSGDLFTIGGTRGSCSVQYVAYAKDGTVTASTGNAVNLWFPSPKDRDEINGPGGTRATPCNGHVIDLAPFNLSRALVVCDDGVAMSTRDSGETWRPVAEIRNTLAIASGNGTYWLAGTDTGCDGITVRSLTINGANSSQGVSRCAPADDFARGKVALHVTGNAIWVWAGSQIQVSTDAGRTWN
jgi:hypothetical protein